MRLAWPSVRNTSRSAPRVSPRPRARPRRSDGSGSADPATTRRPGPSSGLRSPPLSATTAPVVSGNRVVRTTACRPPRAPRRRQHAGCLRGRLRVIPCQERFVDLVARQPAGVRVEAQEKARIRLRKQRHQGMEPQRVAPRGRKRGVPRAAARQEEPCSRRPIAAPPGTAARASDARPTPPGCALRHTGHSAGGRSYRAIAAADADPAPAGASGTYSKPCGWSAPFNQR